MALTHLGYLNLDGIGVEIEITASMILLAVIIIYAFGHAIGKEAEHAKYIKEAKNRLRDEIKIVRD